MLLGAFAILLHRLTGRRDLVIGSAFANRPRAEFEDLIGFFVNTLPLRLRVDEDESVRTWLRGVARDTLDAFDHQAVPFQTLVEAVAPQRTGTRTPLVNVMFVLQNVPDVPLTLAGLDVRPLVLERTTAKFDLTLEVTPAADDFNLAFEYRPELFTTDTIESLLDAFATLVGEMVARPDRPLADLLLLTPAALKRQLHTWNATQAPLAGERVEVLFERQAGVCPEAIAVTSAAGHQTYRMLDERANQLARRLRLAGASAACIGICFERGPDAVAAILAILKAGGTYVPLDPHYPPERLRHMLHNARIGFVLTDRESCAAVRALDVCVLRVDDEIGADDSAVAPPIASPDCAAAYVMYTSGSTGVPKGVLVPHAGIERLVRYQEYVEIGPEDRVAHASTLAFDASTFELWGALLNGARLVVVPTAVLLAPRDLQTAIERDGITVLYLNAALAREIARTAPASLSGLKYLLVGGEVLDIATAARLRAGAPNVRLRNMYGPTETTTFATWHPVESIAGVPAVPIGRPIANTRVYVLDAQLRPLPAGAGGELYIGGPGLALGYLNDAELTARKFVPDPFDPDSAARLYATGDRARYCANGEIEFLGRADAQIKRRGFRIELPEIEAALRAGDDVDDAAVIPYDDGNGDRRLVAFVATSIESATIGARLRDRLPAFMLPDTVVTLPALPRNQNAKIDRELLKSHAFPERSHAVSEPENEAQAALRALWERLLGVAPISLTDDFFVLGGHSLLAMRMLGEIERAFGIRLASALLFERPTIEYLARALCDDPVNRERDVYIFNPGAELRPLHFFHGSLQGGGFYCRALADALGTRRSVYALRPQRADTPTALRSIEAIAAEHLVQIRRLQPHGPYLLGGYCNGGLVAFEVARRLRVAGEAVSNVILLEVPDAAPRVRHIAAAIDRAGALVRIGERQRTRLIGLLAGVPYRWSRFVSHPAKASAVRRRFAVLLRPGARAANAGDAPRTQPEIAAWARLTEAYVPRPYDGRLTLLATQRNGLPAAHGVRGWTSVAPQVDVRTIPGDHLTCITSGIDTTAGVLAAALADEQ